MYLITGMLKLPYFQYDVGVVVHNVQCNNCGKELRTE